MKKIKYVEEETMIKRSYEMHEEYVEHLDSNNIY